MFTCFGRLLAHHMAGLYNVDDRLHVTLSAQRNRDDSCEIEVVTSMYSPSLPAPLHVMRPVSFICVHKARLASKPGRRSRYSIVTGSKEAIQIIAHVFVYIYIYMCT